MVSTGGLKNGLVTDDEVCQNSYGPNSKYSGETKKSDGSISLACDCKAGYVWSDGGKTCQLSERQNILPQISPIKAKEEIVVSQKIALSPANQTQLLDIMRLCTTAKVDCSLVLNYYNTDAAFREKLDILISQYNAKISQQQIQSQQIAQQNLKCLTDPLPSEYVGASPSAIMYYRQMACGTLTPVDTTNYQLDRLNEQLFELKLQQDNYRTQQNIPSYQSSQQYNNATWQITNNGNGTGQIRSSSFGGKNYNYECYGNGNCTISPINF